MSHAYRASDGIPGYLIETWFNPPATQALAMPGWFDRHFENMRRYRHMACSGVLVGTTQPGRVKPGRTAPEIEYTASPADRGRVVEGLQVAGRIWLEAGADRVMPATFAWQEYRTAKALSALAQRIRDSGDLLLTSAHPQGGNALGDRGRRGFPRARLREPLPVRRERVPDQRAREPAADRDGDGAVRRAAHPRATRAQAIAA